MNSYLAAWNSVCYNTPVFHSTPDEIFMAIHLFRKPVFCAALLFSLISFTGAESYYFKDLGTLGGNTSQAYALNNSGQVVGFAAISNNVYSHAVLFSGTGSNNTDLDSQGPVSYVGEARGINDSGQIIGWANTSSGRIEATLFTASGKVNLGDLCGSSPTASEAQAINSSGTGIGFADDCSFTAQGCRFSGQGSNNVSLGGIGGGINGVAYDINASGQIVGYGTRSDNGAQHATLFRGSGNVDLGALGGFNSHAYGINNAGQIVGDSAITGNSAFHAVLFSGTGSNNIDLGTLGGATSHANAINNGGEIVGNSYPATNNNTIYHAFIYKNGVMSDVNALVLPGSGFSNIRLIEAGSRVPGRAINDSGQIAAVGEIGGSSHAILLTPVLRKMSVVINGNDIIVKFDAMAGNTYRLKQTLDLANPNWQSVPGVSDFTAATTGPAQFTYTNGLTLGKAYYKVQFL
jgi:probable HAF family extracellular repeat protein